MNLGGRRSESSHCLHTLMSSLRLFAFFFLKFSLLPISHLGGTRYQQLTTSGGCGIGAFIYFVDLLLPFLIIPLLALLLFLYTPF